jgi:nitrogen regulatory protein PII
VKLLLAMIKPFKLEEVKKSLREIGIEGMTVFEAKGFGRQFGHTEIYRGSEYAVDFLPKIVILVALPDNQLERARKAITVSAKTGKIGDGMIFVIPLESMLRIRTETFLSDTGIELPPNQPEIPKPSPGSSPTPESPQVRHAIIANLKANGYEVEPLVRVNGALIDFQLRRDGSTSYALYRSAPESTSVTYLYGVGEKWIEKILICDVIDKYVENLCAYLGMKYITTDLLEAKKQPFAPPFPSPGTIQISHVENVNQGGAPQTSNVSVRGQVKGGISFQYSPPVKGVVEQLQSLLPRLKELGANEIHCRDARKALSTLSHALDDLDSPGGARKSKSALETLKNVEKPLGTFAAIGGQFSTLLKQLEPAIVAIFRLCS